MRCEIITGCKSLADLLFPRRCVVCGRDLLLFEKHICMECMVELPLTYFWKWRTRGLYSLFYYSGDYRKILYSLKYRSNVQLALYMGRLLGQRLKEGDIRPDYIIPVPLHYLKRWKRGYNQSYIIARGIKRELGKGVAVRQLLKRRRFTKTQTRKEKRERWLNVHNAFGLKRSSPRGIERYARMLKGKKILIVDDVLTTGATADACRTLLQRFDCRIWVATLAYVE